MKELKVDAGPHKVSADVNDRKESNRIQLFFFFLLNRDHFSASLYPNRIHNINCQDKEVNSLTTPTKHRRRIPFHARSPRWLLW